MLQQLPWAVLFFWLGGLPWLVWGVPMRVAVSVTGHWLVGHLTHRRGPQGWVVDGVAVQGHDLPVAALLTFGEAWHGNHHAWPDSAKLGWRRVSTIPAGGCCWRCGGWAGVGSARRRPC